MTRTEQEKRDYQKAYRKASREKSAAATKAWQEANPGWVKAINKAYCIANRDRALAAAKLCRETARVATAAKKP